MAFSSAIVLRFCLILVLFSYSLHGSAILNDDYVAYELVDSQSKLEREDTFLPDMVFVDTGNNVRLKRQLRSDTNPSSHVSPEDEKLKAAGSRKKVPSGFNTTSTNSGKPTKLDGPTSGVYPEKKVAEKSGSSPKAVAAVSVEARDPSFTPPPLSTTVSSVVPVTNPAVKISADRPTPTKTAAAASAAASAAVAASAAAAAAAAAADPPAPTLAPASAPGNWDVEHPGSSQHAPSGVIVGEDDKFPDEITNSTLAQEHVFNKTEDHHTYYNSSSYEVRDLRSLWVDMESTPKVMVNAMLSQAHRRAATVALTFDFPFYGHLVKNVTIATGGFLYTGEYVHSWLAATQYIAPLMANFDTSLSNESFVKYVDNGTAFTVEWCKVVLQDKPNEGDFSFQVTLHSNGDIVFVYKNVPILIDKIKDDNHPVKVGLSDAYIIDRTIFFVRRKTIYEYHRVNFTNIKNGTVIYLRALPTCLDQKNCLACVSQTTNFECNWCQSAERCSNGMDRYRQDWLLKGCEPTDTLQAKLRTNQCLPEEVVVPETNHVHEIEEAIPRSKAAKQSQDAPIIISHQDQAADDVGVSMSGVVGILLLVVCVCSLGLWVLYAYRHPHSSSGQWLIRYRPSTWTWRRGEARYTAATIHM